MPRGGFVVTRQNVTMAFIPLCAHTRYLNIPSVVDGDDWCQASGKAGEFSRERVQGRGVLLTGVPLRLSLPGGDRTVLVGEQNLLQLTHLRPQRRHLVLEKTNTEYPPERCGVCVCECVLVGARLTCSCRFVCVSSSAFFSSDDTQSFLFCRQRVAAARLRSRNFCLRSSGSCSVVLLRLLPPPPPPPPPGPLQLPPA